MTNFIVQSYFENTRHKNRDVMTALSAARDVISESSNKIESINDLDLDEQAHIAAGCYEDIKRNDTAEIIGELDSDINCAIIRFLSDDDLNNRDDLCDAIKKSFATYFRNRIRDAIEEALIDIADDEKYNHYDEDLRGYDD